MRVRAKEIRKARKREEERLKDKIKEIKAAKAPVQPTRARTRRTSAPAQQ